LDRSGSAKTRLNSSAARRRAERGNALFLMNQALIVDDLCLRDQTGAAFGTACVEHFTTTARGHPGPKTVGSSALYAAGLKSTFHDRFSEQLIWMVHHFVPIRP